MSRVFGRWGRAAIPWQMAVAVALCVGLALLMIVNNQLGGEAMWFWYGRVFRSGVRLYSGLHLALQPLFVLETAGWQRLFGERIVVDEIPSLIHAGLLALSLLLILRESAWGAGARAVMLLGCFVYTVAGHSYRFDDYHVVAEALIFYALLLLLWLGRPGEACGAGRQAGLVAALGAVCGLTFVTRVTDGAALVVASAVCLPVLLRRGRGWALGLFGAVAGLTAVAVVWMTGDTLGAYLTNSIFRAAGSKGGTGSIFAAPFAMVAATAVAVRGEKMMLAALAGVVLVGWGVWRWWPAGRRWIVPLQLGFMGLVYLAAPRVKQGYLRRGMAFEFLVLFLTLAMYGAAVWVGARWVRTRGRAAAGWDPRWVLVVVPILEWASYSAGAAAEPLTNYYAPVAMLLLLIPVLEPWQRWAGWADRTVLSVTLLVAVSGVATKIWLPYSWQNYAYPPMFAGRTWYRHPLYGWMYIDDGLLRFSEGVCRDIGAVPGRTQPALLSLPYPYPNYFCGTPPWHDYVQTFFDTAPRSTVERLMGELQRDPPEWIVYQRQLNIMKGAERLYNHGRPLAQRELDALVMGRIASGQWQLVDRSDYLRPDNPEQAQGTGWYVVRTRR